MLKCPCQVVFLGIAWISLVESKILRSSFKIFSFFNILLPDSSFSRNDETNSDSFPAGVVVKVSDDHGPDSKTKQDSRALTLYLS